VAHRGPVAAAGRAAAAGALVAQGTDRQMYRQTDRRTANPSSQAAGQMAGRPDRLMDGRTERAHG
jgi:hypothetical protein